MHIRKYDLNYSRRHFLESVSKGALAAGVLTPLWPLIGNTAEIDKAYPDELLSIELYTKGKVKVGDVITADNVEYVKDLLDPIAFIQVSQMGRRINIVETTRDVTKMYPHEYLEATLRNSGQAVFDETGNVFTKDGKRWIGGSPFPNPTSANQMMANSTLSWGRHDQSMYAVRDWDIGPSGKEEYQYDFVWAEMNTSGLVNDPARPYMEGDIHQDKLRYQSVWFTHPNDSKGTSFLNTWYYDQTRFPDLMGYLPAFKRVRRFPTNQRFEPLVPGMSLFLSDAWAAGDPMLTWGNNKIIGRGPMLGAQSNNFPGGNDNWEPGTHGGPKGNTFWDVSMELCPDVVVYESEPIGYPRAPLSKKRTWYDMRNGAYVAYVTYDRRGEIWKSFEPHYSQYSQDGVTVNDGDHPAWSWRSVHSHDIQTNRMSRFYQAKEVRGGFKSVYNTGEEMYDKFLTVQAMRRLGR
jgi:hypothetical protein